MTMAMEKIQPTSVSFQSPGADLLIPSSRVSGRLKTLNAYAWPMHRWMHSAAGGTNQRLNRGPATVRDLAQQARGAGARRGLQGICGHVSSPSVRSDDTAAQAPASRAGLELSTRREAAR